YSVRLRCVARCQGLPARVHEADAQQGHVVGVHHARARRSRSLQHPSSPSCTRPHEPHRSVLSRREGAAMIGAATHGRRNEATEKAVPGPPRTAAGRIRFAIVVLVALATAGGLFLGYVHGQGPWTSAATRHLRVMKERARAPVCVETLTFRELEALPRGL